jgi:hypothetical protein
VKIGNAAAAQRYRNHNKRLWMSFRAATVSVGPSSSFDGAATTIT